MICLFIGFLMLVISIFIFCWKLETLKMKHRKELEERIIRHHKELEQLTNKFWKGMER